MTFLPAFKISAARVNSSSGGVIAIEVGADELRETSLFFRRFLALHGLHVVRNDNHTRLAVSDRDAARAIHHDLRLRGRHDGLHVSRHVGKGALQIIFLLIGAAQRFQCLLPDNRDDRLIVHVGVIQTVQHMERAGAGSRGAHTEFARPFGVRGRHQGADFFVRRTDVFERQIGAVGASQRAVERADAIAGKTENVVNAPFDEAVNDEIADGVAGFENAHKNILVEMKFGCRRF